MTTTHLITETYNALESVLDYDDIDCVEAVAYRQGALWALREVIDSGVTVPEGILDNWLAVSRQAIDIYKSCEETA